MKILLLGATDLTLALLCAMREAGHAPAGVVSIGREFSISYNPRATNARFVDIEGFCEAHSIAHLAYARDNAALNVFADSVAADLCIVAGWYFMLPASFRERFPKGCIGIHASLLPQLRGAAPLNWAILNGMEHTGVSIFEIAAGMDEGKLFAQRAFPVSPRETVTSLVQKTEEAGIAAMLQVIAAIEAGTAQPFEQTGPVSYACPRKPEDSAIRWDQSAEAIDRLIRASTRPYAGAYGMLDDAPMLVWEAEPFTAFPVYGRPGQIAILAGVAEPVILCGEGAIRILDATDSEGSSVLPKLRFMNYATLGNGGA